MNKTIKKREYLLIVFSIIYLILYVSIDSNKVLVKTQDYDNKYSASKTTKVAFEKIREEKIRQGIEINLDYDVNDTGLIGEGFNGITTTSGTLEAKRTSTNYNFSGVLVDVFNQLGLSPGDKVGLNLSSSFPALNIASLVACDTLGLEVFSINSIGSSTFGGNNIDFTYMDMEEFLYRNKLIKNRSTIISIGGAGDIGTDMDHIEVEKILNRAKEYDRQVFIEEDLEKNIEKRYNMYLEEKIDVFVNVGGNIVAFGNTMDGLYIGPGILKNEEFKVGNKSGLIQRFYNDGIPVIHILNIRELALINGLEIDPKSGFQLGRGDFYYEYKYSRIGLVLSILLLPLVLIIYRRLKRNDEATSRY